MLTGRVDVSRLLKRFDAMKRRAGAKGLEKVFRELRDPMRGDQRDHSKKREGPDGPWPERKQSTIDRAQRRRRSVGKNGKVRFRKRRLRKLLGRLPGAIDVKARGVAVFAKSRVRWAKIHQEGGTAGHGSVIQERPFLYVSEEMESLAQSKFVEALKEGWDEGGR